MTIRDAIEGRRSIRKYKRQSIRREVLYDVLWSGMLAPNANNSQDWFFISIEERAHRVSGRRHQGIYGPEQ